MRRRHGGDPAYSVSIHADSSGSLGSSLVTLTKPSSLPSSRRSVRFTVPGGGIALTPGTKYWVVMNANSNGLNVDVRTTNSSNEDSGAEAGWSIADSALSRTWSSGQWAGTFDAIPRKIALHGYAAVPIAIGSASVDGATLKLVFNTPLDEESVPAKGSFSVLLDGTAQTPTAVSVDDRTVTFTLATAATPGQAALVSYTKPGSKRLRDSFGREAKGFARQAVVNATGGLTTVDAGADREVLTGASVTLSGSGSSTRSGATFTYKWTQSGGVPVTLSGATTASPTFTAPSVRTDLEFALVANDGVSDSAADTVTVRVRPGPNPTSAPCVHPAPADAQLLSSSLLTDVVVNDSNVAFRGDGSSDRFSYWLCHPDGVREELEQNIVGTEATSAFGLEDDSRYWAAWKVERAAGTSWYQWFALPRTGVATADAGADQEVVTGSTVTLSGSGSSSTRSGATLTYAWTQTGGKTVTLSSATAQEPTFTAPALPEDLEFSLVVNDGTSDSAADTVTVRARPPPNPTSAPCVQPTIAGGQLTTTELFAVTETTDSVIKYRGTDQSNVTDLWFCWPDGTREQRTDNSHNQHINTVSGLESGTTYWLTATNHHPIAGGQRLWNAWKAVTTTGAASIKRVAFTSSPASGDSYRIGESIRAAVTWSQPVTVDTKGSNVNVRLRLDLGTDDTDRGNSRKRMPYVSGSGTDTLTFAYTVKPGDIDPDGVWLQTESATVDFLVAFSNGGTIRTGTTDVKNTRAGLPTTGDASRKVDGATSATAAAGPDQEVGFGASVTLSGSGSSTRTPTPTTYTYAWTQTGGETVTLSSATAQEPTFTAPSVRTDLEFALTVNDGVQDSAADTVTVRVRPPPNPTSAPCADPGLGALRMSDLELDIDTITDTSLQFGGVNLSATYDLWFCRPDGTREERVTGVGAAHVETVSGLASGTTYWVMLKRSHPVHGVSWTNWKAITTTGAASIKRVAFTTAPASGDSYRIGETIRAAVTWSQPVTVDTKGANVNVRLRLDLGPDDADRGNSRKRMPYVSGSGTDTLTFAYTVQPGDIDPDGVWLQTESATVDNLVAFSNGGTIRTGTTDVKNERAGLPTTGDASRKVDGTSSATAAAGPDQEVLTGASVTLSGSGSSTRTPTPTTYTYAWTQTGGETVTLSSATAQEPTFTAPSVRTDLEFALTVNDGVQDSAADTVTVRVRPPPNPTSAPCADPGLGALRMSDLELDIDTITDTSLQFGGVNLSATYDLWFCRPDGTREERVTGVGAAHVETVSGLASGTTYWVMLKRSHPVHGVSWTNWKAITTTGAATIKRVAFTNAPTWGSPGFGNAPPRGDAYRLGDTIRAAVTWSMPVTVDAKGANANVSLRLDLGPDDADRGNSRKRMAYVSGTGTDTLTFEYAVKPGDIDADGVWLQTESASDDTAVFLANGATLRNGTTDVARTRAGLPTTGDASRKVSGATSATAEAGDDQEVLTGASVTLSGSGSSRRNFLPPTFTYGYQWTQTGGPTVTLSGATTATPTFTAPTVRTDLEFSLVVNDGLFDSVADTVTVRVRPGFNPTSAPCVQPKVGQQTATVLLEVTETTDSTIKYRSTRQGIHSQIDTLWFCRPDGTREELAANVNGSHTETVSGLASGTTYWVTATRDDDGTGNDWWYPWQAVTTTGGPSLESASVRGTTLTLTFDEALHAGSVPAAIAFTVTRTPAGGRAERVRLAGLPALDGATVTLTLAAAVAPGDAVTVGYAAPETNPLRNTGGAPVPDFSEQPADNRTGAPDDATKPELLQGKIHGSAVELTFSEAIDGGALPAADRFVLSPDLGAVSGVRVSGREMFFTTATASTATQSVSVSIRAPTGIRDLNGNALGVVAGFALINTLATDPGKPALASTSPPVVDGAALTLTFDQTLRAVTVPAAGAFTVTVAGKARGVAGVAVDGKTVVLTLASPAANGDVVTVSYAAAKGNLQNPWGTQADSFTETVVNGTANRAPEFNAGQDTTIAPARTLHSLEAVATDPDGDALTYSLSPSRDDTYSDLNHRVDIGRLFFQAKDGCALAHLDPPPANPLDTVVTVTASDPDGATDERELTYRTSWSCAAPVVETVTVDAATGRTVTLTFDKTLQAMTAAQLEELRFAITVVGAYAKGTRDSGLGPGRIEIDGKKVILHIGGQWNFVEALPGRPIAVEIAPVLEAARTEGKRLTLTFDRALDAGSAPAGRRFFAQVHVPGEEGYRYLYGTGTSVVGGETVRVTLESAVRRNEQVWVWYQQGDDANPLRGSTGLKVGDIWGFLRTVEQDRSAPELKSAVLAGTKLALYYGERLDRHSTPAPGDFALALKARPAAPTVSAVSVHESAVTLTLGAAVGAGDAVTLSYTAGAEPIRDVEGNDAADLESVSVTNHGPADTAAPALAATAPAVARLGVLTLAWDKPLDPAQVPAAGAFTLSQRPGYRPGSFKRSVTSVAVRGAKVELGLNEWAHPCSFDDYTLSYAVPSGDKAASALRSVWGVEAAALTDQAVTIDRGTRRCRVTSVRLSTEEVGGSRSASSLQMTFDRALERDAPAPVAEFQVMSDGGGGAGAGAVAVADAAYPEDPAGLALTLGRPLVDGERLTVNYRLPRVGPGLRDADGNQLAAFSVETVVGAEAPAVAGVTVVSDAGSDATYAAGEAVRVAVTFTEAVDVDTANGTPRLKLDTSAARTARASGGRRTRTARAPTRSPSPGPRRRRTRRRAASRCSRTRWSSTAAPSARRHRRKTRRSGMRGLRPTRRTRSTPRRRGWCGARSTAAR